jgi:transposase InsO family protein
MRRPRLAARLARLRPALPRRGNRALHGRTGSAPDSAVCESFFSGLKKELVDRRPWATKAEARSAVFEWIEDSRRRRHSTLGYLSPATFEEQSQIKKMKEKEAA